MKLNNIFFALLLITGFCACRSAAPKNAAVLMQEPQNIHIVKNYTQAHNEIAAQVAADITTQPAPQTQAQQGAKTIAKNATKPAVAANPQNTKAAAVQNTQPAAAQQAGPANAAQPATAQPNMDKNIINDAEGRLTHPWALAPEIAFPSTLKKPVWYGESLTFSVSWALITAGEATISTGKTIKADGQPALEMKTTAKSYATLDKMFKVRDINISWLAADGSKSLGYWQSLREGSYARDEWIVFDYPHKRFITYKKNRKGEISTFETTLKKDKVLDMLTALYFVRMQPLPVKGEVFFDIVNGGKEYPLKVIVHGKEKVKVKAGTFDCIVVEPLISGDGIFVSKGKSLKVWLTDDEYKMPVKMSVEVFIGSVKAELVNYSR